MHDEPGLMYDAEVERLRGRVVDLERQAMQLQAALLSAERENQALARLADKADALIESQRETIAVQTEAYQALLDHHYSIAQRRARFDKEVVKTEQLLRGYPAEDTVH